MTILRLNEEFTEHLWRS